MPNRIVLATRNEHKVGELRAILGDVVAELDLEVVGLSAYPDLPDVVEHGDDRTNLELLLAQLDDVPDVHRGAGFVCAAALAVPGRLVVVEEGHFRGTLTRAPRGSNGFGYDPILQVDGDPRTSAELSPTEKNARSHRGAAFRALIPHLRVAFGRG